MICALTQLGDTYHVKKYLFQSRKGIQGKKSRSDFEKKKSAFSKEELGQYIWQITRVLEIVFKEPLKVTYYVKKVCEASQRPTFFIN